MYKYLVLFNGRKLTDHGVFSDGYLTISLKLPLATFKPGELPIEVFAAIQNAGYQSNHIIKIGPLPLKAVRCSVCQNLCSPSREGYGDLAVGIPGNHSRHADSDGYAIETDRPECEGSERNGRVEVIEEV